MSGLWKAWDTASGRAVTPAARNRSSACASACFSSETTVLRAPLSAATAGTAMVPA